MSLARALVIDQSALVETLEDREIRGAALDVSDPGPVPEDSPLRSVHNVVMCPHAAGSSPDYTDGDRTVCRQLPRLLRRRGM